MDTDNEPEFTQEETDRLLVMQIISDNTEGKTMDKIEVMAKAMYEDWKSRERVIRDEWPNVSPGMRKVFVRYAEAAHKALNPK